MYRLNKLTFILFFVGSMLYASEDKRLFERFKDWGEEKPSTKIYIFGSLGSVNSSDSEGKKWSDSYFPSKEERKTGSKLGIGYSINKYFSIEGQFINLGNTKYSGNYSYIDESDYDIYSVGVAYEGVEKLEIDSKGFGINLVGKTPSYKDFSIFGKVGFHMISTEYKYIDTYETYQIYQKVNILEYTRRIKEYSESKTIRSNIATFGIGILYNIQEKWFISLEHERFNSLSKGNFLGKDTEYDANITSFGLGFRF